MSTGAAGDDAKADTGLIQRGVKGTTIASKALFVGLRAADPLLQYQILRHDWGAGIINALGSSTLPHGPAAMANTPLEGLHLSPYRLILLAMSAGSAAKQIYWLLGIAYEQIPPSASVVISALNTTVNTLNNLFFICRATSASVNGEHFPQTPLLIGAGLYALGIGVEAVSETQRYNFKKDPANKGRAYTGGLFGVARHINYTGYMLWRSGYALAAGGYGWAFFTGAWFFYNFTNQIPLLDRYCTEHYDAQWVAYKEKTPYRMIPYIY